MFVVLFSFKLRYQKCLDARPPSLASCLPTPPADSVARRVKKGMQSLLGSFKSYRSGSQSPWARVQMIHCPLNTGPITTAPVSLSLVLLFILLPYDLSRHLVYSVQSSLWGKCVSEKIAFIYIFFSAFTLYKNFKLSSPNRWAPGIKCCLCRDSSCESLIFLCFNRNNAMNVEYGCIIF